MPAKKLFKEGVKFDSERVQLQLLPPAALHEIAAVLTFGARKYDEWNWAKGIKAGRLVRAALGHIWAWWAGEENDPESGLSHLAHAGCCILFLLDQSRAARGAQFDDRFRDHPPLTKDLPCSSSQNSKKSLS